MTTDINSQTITHNLEETRQRIELAASVSGRSAEDVLLVAVSKRHPVRAIAAAYQAGVKHFGENRVAECVEKVSSLPQDIHWHMVGGLQSRKASDAAPVFEWVHSIDRLKIARKLSDAIESDMQPLQVLVQVNVSGEASKSGYELSAWPASNHEYDAFISEMSALSDYRGVRIRGLMTMAPYVEDPQQTRPVFQKMRQLQQALQREMPALDWEHLSMGMTNDYEVAIEEGATIVRLGTAIFGPRSY